MDSSWITQGITTVLKSSWMIHNTFKTALKKVLIFFKAMFHELAFISKLLLKKITGLELFIDSFKNCSWTQIHKVYFLTLFLTVQGRFTKTFKSHEFKNSFSKKILAQVHLWNQPVVGNNGDIFCCLIYEQQFV